MYNEDFIGENALFVPFEYFNKWFSLPQEMQLLNDLHRVHYCSYDAFRELKIKLIHKFLNRVQLINVLPNKDHKCSYTWASYA